MEATSLSLPTEGALAEAARQQLEATALAKTAVEAVKFAEEAMTAAAAAKLAIETTAKQQQELEKATKRDAAEAVPSCNDIS